jgi:hypothetical protein
MNSARICARLVITMVLSVALSTVCGQGKPRQQKALTVCQLVKSWKNYNRQTVRLRAIYAVGPVTDWLYDPACGDAYVGVRFRDDVKGPYAKLDRVVSEDTTHSRAWVTIEGVFYGPEPYSDEEIARTPPQLRDLFRKGHRRYGHMDMFDSIIEVANVVKVSRVADKVPVTKIDPGRKIFPDLP